MTKKDNSKFMFDNDVHDVTGVRKSDKLLQVGNLFIGGKYVSDCRYIENSDDVGYKKVYDKIFVGSEVFEQPDLFAKLTCINAGTISVFHDNDDDLQRLAETIETLWYPARVWNLNSSIGKCLITDAKGPPTFYEDYGDNKSNGKN